MTTNARDEKWSEWKEWKGGTLPPVSGETVVDVKYRCGKVACGSIAETYRWTNKGCDVDIIAYRYKIKEPESDMHPDLRLCAENLAKWPEGSYWVAPFEHRDGVRVIGWPKDCPPITVQAYSYREVVEAAKDLGLIMSDAEEEIPAHEWAGSVPVGVQTYKQLRYQDAKGEDWIDEFARTASVDEFRGAMRFTLGKYNRRAGKKDELVREIEKMRDYCDRWIEYERSL